MSEGKGKTDKSVVEDDDDNNERVLLVIFCAVEKDMDFDVDTEVIVGSICLTKTVSKITVIHISQLEEKIKEYRCRKVLGQNLYLTIINIIIERNLK